MEQVKASTDAQLQNVMPPGPLLVLPSCQQIASPTYSSGALIIGHK